MPAGTYALRVGTGLDDRGLLKDVQKETTVAVPPDGNVTGLRLVLK